MFDYCFLNFINFGMLIITVSFGCFAAYKNINLFGYTDKRVN